MFPGINSLLLFITQQVVKSFNVLVLFKSVNKEFTKSSVAR